ncbi:hypothetical protein EYC80_009394 [Monilinia laxa]|uniref:FAD-binding PCMH-type domain-containing protein n=1 Tax=Monilinia laxa TaxID=61186 RepID=A0A5N6JXN9_MONLA|nr:hypothetical protein EYC80_009394 [Monilinia laxa]
MNAFWSGQASDDRPNCIVQPTIREHVAAVVKILTHWQCQFSVKGGHTPSAGAASINNGVTIDLAKLNTISVDKNVGVAYIGAGLKWGAIYEYLESNGIMVSGGRASLVGIGGLVVGDVERDHEDDPKANFLQSWACQQMSGTQRILNVIDYVAPIEAPVIYSGALSIPDLVSNTMRITNFNSRNIFVTATFLSSAEMYETAVNISNKYMGPLRNITGLVWFLLFQPIPLIVSEHTVAAGGNIMGVDRNKANLTLFLINVTWLEASDDEKFTDAADAAIDEINAVAESLGVSNPFIYLNYAGQKQNPLAGYGEENLKKMRALSKRYDHQGVFQKLVKGGFKDPGMKYDMEE